MAGTDISGPLARIKNRIESVASIGLVHDHDIFDRDDVLDLIVSTIATVSTLRVWMITGPGLPDSVRISQGPNGVEREWEYSIIGLEGLRSDGTSIATLRANALAVSDALDSDWSLGNTCHRTRPTRIVDGPDNRAIQIGEDSIGVSYVELAKPVITLSTP